MKTRIEVEEMFWNVLSRGFNLEMNFISPDFADSLLHEISKLGLTAATDPHCVLVKQKFERVAFRSIPKDMPALDRLDESIQTLTKLASDGFPNLISWAPNDITIQKYSDTDFISGHRDLLRHVGVIAIVNLIGCCKLEILPSRNGNALYELRLKPGDLLLLRAPGLRNDMGDNRPFHRVSGNQDISSSHRISVTFRVNSRPNEPIPGHSYEN